ncbi:hypothetical protein ACTA71_003760 [Dictyostelium dimigraforme]
MKKQSEFLKEFKDIDELKNINNLSIEIIERRAKIIQDNTSDPESWRYRSFDGFLGENESFKERLKTDWKLLEQWNKDNRQSLTHIDISNKLKDVINQCEQVRKDLNFGPMAPIKLLYNKEIELYVIKNIYNGFQYSLFWNEKQKQLQQEQKKQNQKQEKEQEQDNQEEIWNRKWNIEYKIQNIKTQQEIIVSGDIDGGIINYIECLGFYEGDELNQYRINPIKLLSILMSK